jgi:ubiquitin C-terminal hydrolase
LGNTCYLNALLFALSKLPRVRRWLSQHQQHQQEDKHAPATCVLCWLAQDVAKLAVLPCNEPFAPEVARRRAHWNTDFNNTSQQDAHDACVTLLENCDRVDLVKFKTFVEIEHGAVQYTTPFWETFGGRYKQTTRCTVCKKTIAKNEMFSNMLLAIESETLQTLEACILKHLGEEPMQDRCPNPACRAENKRVKNTRVDKWPKVLVLMLKRWRWQEHQQGFQKISRHISYKTLLQVPGGPPYALRSVVVHSGNGGAGHYTARVRGQDNSWYLCNDAEAPAKISTAIAEAVEGYIWMYEQA